jgi:hypothetical protein
MAKLDEVKEILNTLRLFFSLVVGLIVILTGSLINKEESSDVDIYFWIGSLLDVILLMALFFLIKAIRQQTKTIKDL